MIKYDKNHLYFPNKIVELPSTMEKIILFQDLYLILLKKCTRGKVYSQNSNLCVYDKNGEQFWIAELPTTNPGDSYYELFQEGKKSLPIQIGHMTVI